ncbi:MAG TPA: G/U mismatch-specific DNA glycosylase, partial [Anaerolineaceae bacterium]|nr:G/U mismatch-specific DNA glycosylase [Anaerolineaceae bacterium]
RTAGKPFSGTIAFMPEPARPTKAEVQAAVNKSVPDVIAPNLRVLFCGINPGLYTAAVGHHFARPGNRFWPTLHAAGFTPRLLHPSEERELLAFGYGITNVVNRATATAAELRPEELRAGGRRLVETLERYRPRFLAVLGITAFRAAFDRPEAVIGRQPEAIAGTVVWVLPNPSGLNAHYRLADLADLFRQLRAAAEES